MPPAPALRRQLRCERTESGLGSCHVLRMASFTGSGEIEDGEQRTLLLRRRIAGQPAATPNLSSAMEDSNSSAVNGASCHERDIQAITRVIDMSRAKNMLRSAALSILSQSAALRR